MSNISSFTAEQIQVLQIYSEYTQYKNENPPPSTLGYEPLSSTLASLTVYECRMDNLKEKSHLDWRELNKFCIHNKLHSFDFNNSEHRHLILPNVVVLNHARYWKHLSNDDYGRVITKKIITIADEHHDRESLHGILDVVNVATEFLFSKVPASLLKSVGLCIKNVGRISLEEVSANPKYWTTQQSIGLPKQEYFTPEASAQTMMYFIEHWTSIINKQYSQTNIFNAKENQIESLSLTNKDEVNPFETIIEQHEKSPLMASFLKKINSSYRESETSDSKVSNDINLNIIDSVAEHIKLQFEADGDIQICYKTYRNEADRIGNNFQQRYDNLEQYQKNVKQICDNKKCTQVYLQCNKELSTMLSQTAHLTNNKNLANTSLSLSAITSSITGYHEFNNAVGLFKTANDITSMGSAFASSLVSINMFLSAASIVLSLFGKKEKYSGIDFSAATYSALMVMWTEIRQEFKAIHVSFEKTWYMMEWMNNENKSRFQMLLNAIERNEYKMKLQLTQLSYHIDSRLNTLEWKLDQIEKRNKKSSLSISFTQLLQTTHESIIGPTSETDRDMKLNTLLSHFGFIGSQRETFSGKRVGSNTEISLLQDIIEDIDNPFFSLCTLSSYLNTKLSHSEMLYSRSQMNNIINILSKKNSKYKLLNTISIGEFQTLTVCDNLIIPITFFGSWLLLVIDDQKQGYLVGLQYITDQCVLFLISILNDILVRPLICPNVVMNDISKYLVHIITLLIEDKINLRSCKDTIDISLCELSVIPINLPEPVEQSIGNPWIDTWLSLHIQKLILPPYDNVPTHILDRISETIGQIETQSQLLTRVQHPSLYKRLIQDYRNVVKEFDQLYVLWSLNTNKRIQEEETQSIKMKLSTMDGIVSPIEDYKFGFHVKPKTEYLNCQWWKITYHWQNVCSRYGHGDGWKSSLTTDQAEVLRQQQIFCQNISRNYNNNIQIQRERIERSRETLSPHYDLINPILTSYQPIKWKGIVYPSCLVPKISGQPYLAAPLNLDTLLLPDLAQAYQCGQVYLRFSYLIIDKIFNIYGEWSEYNKSDKDIEWEIFSHKEYQYDPLFYEGNEAILNFWYGGQMPIDQSVEEVRYAQLTPWSTVGCTQWYTTIKIPVLKTRKGAIEIDINSLPEIASYQEQLHCKVNCWTIKRSWIENLTTKFAESFLQDMDNKNTPLAKVLAKMNKYIHLIRSYLKLITFSFNLSELQQSIDKTFEESLFDSSSIRKCFIDQKFSIYQFLISTPNKNSIDKLESFILESLNKISLYESNLYDETPLACASLLLYEILQKQKIPNINEKRRRLDTYTSNMCRMLDDIFCNYGDVVYSQALKNSIQNQQIVNAKISGQQEIIYQSEYHDLMKLIENQSNLRHKIKVWNQWIYQINVLVQKGIILRDTLEQLEKQYISCIDSYNKMEEILAHISSNFDEIYDECFIVNEKQKPIIAGNIIESCDSFNFKTYINWYHIFTELDKLYDDSQGLADKLEQDKLLEKAFSNGDIDIICTLLSYYQSNIELPIGYHDPKIRYLIDAHEFLCRTSTEMGIPQLNRTLHLINMSVKYIEPINFCQSSAVLLEGATGSGKSTLFNFMTGVEYISHIRDVDGQSIRIKVGGEEIATTGDSGKSTTIVPSIYTLLGKSYSLIDMPGILDNRDNFDESCINPYDITSAVSTYLISKKFQSIKCILVLCPEEHLKSIRPPTELLQLFRQIGRMISSTSGGELSNNIILVVTKHESLSQKHIIGRLQNIAKDFKDPDIMAFLNLFKDESRVMIVDVADDIYRQQLLDKIDVLQSTHLFDFSQYSKYLDRLRSLINKISAMKDNLISEIEQLTNITDKFINGEKLEYNKKIIEQIPKISSYTSEMSVGSLLGCQISSISELHSCKLSHLIQQIEDDYEQYEKNMNELGQLKLRLEVQEKFYHGLYILNNIGLE